MDDCCTVFLNNICFSFLDSTIFTLLNLECLCCSLDDRTIDIFFWGTLFNHDFVIRFWVIYDMAMDFWYFTALVHVNNLSLLSYDVTISVFDRASVNESFMALFILSYSLFSPHDVTLLVLNYFNLTLDLLIILDLISRNCLNFLLLLTDLHCILFVFNFGYFSFRFNNISFGILYNSFLNNFNFAFFLNHIFLMLEHRPIITSFNLNSILLFPDQNSVNIDDLISFNHSSLILLFNYFWFVFMHISVFLTFDLYDISLDSNDFTARIFNCVSVYKRSFSLLLDQLLFMGMSIS